MKLFLMLFLLKYAQGLHKGTFIGCFKAASKSKVDLGQNSLEDCLNGCEDKKYRYTLLPDLGNCFCGNFLGQEVNSTTFCKNACQNCDDRHEMFDVYFTGNLYSAPPTNMVIKNVTDTTLHISWGKPESYVDILGYQIKAMVLHSFSSYPPTGFQWRFSNDTFQTQLITLQPATRYNISLQAQSSDGYGAAASQIIETEVGVPDNAPSPPVIVSKKGALITVKLEPVTNNNGPVTSYKVVVVNEDMKQGFQQESLTSADQAKKDGISYYIAAEIFPQELKNNFLVGDGKHYGRYYNAPINPSINYNIILGVVSKYNGITKEAYSNSNKNGIVVLDVHSGPQKTSDMGDSPGIIIALSIAIGVLSCVLVAGVIGFIFLRSKIANRRQRLSDNQELTVQGPMIEVENHGYLPEEEVQVNHYKSLKQKLKIYSSQQVRVDYHNILAIGKFGKIHNATIQENQTVIPALSYSIADKSFSKDERRVMLKELDLLLRTEKHNNVIELLGTCETSHLLNVLMECISMNLKDFLLGSRDTTNARFSSLTEAQALSIAIQIAQGMAHLEFKKIVHKQLVARNVLLDTNLVPKISGYGLAQFYNNNKITDYTRWTALEVFRGMEPSSKSDTWSFAVLLWEICALGGTPYGNISNTNDIPEKIIKGLRLPQLQNFSDDLYQTMLNCWQIDMDERPNFTSLIDLLENLNDCDAPFLSFSVYSNFQYEQFYPHMEFANQSVI